jgi:S1-C subfamily serine protease
MNPSNVTLFSTSIRDFKNAKKEWSQRLFNVPRTEGFRALATAASIVPNQNVVGVGIGEQIVDGKPTGAIALKFLVRVKYPAHELSRRVLLPKSVNSLLVDVEEVGFFRRFVTARPSKAVQTATTMPNPKAKLRPAAAGCSVGYREPGNEPPMAGTFGALVKDKAGLYILSNNHVLAGENRLSAGAGIYQPGLLDGGTPETDQVAALSRFIELKATGNQVDCAIAKVANKDLVSADTLRIGSPAGTARAAIDMSVHKFGRTTAYTVGRVASIDTDVTVGYETGNFTFHEQIIIVGQNGIPFSNAGDSGSLILERQTNKAIGLLFAGSYTHTVANHIEDVLKALKVNLA